MYNASVTDDTNFTIYTYFYIYFKTRLPYFNIFYGALENNNIHILAKYSNGDNFYLLRTESGSTVQVYATSSYSTLYSAVQRSLPGNEGDYLYNIYRYFIIFAIARLFYGIPDDYI